MNILAVMQIFRQHNGYNDEELKAILNDRLLKIPIATQLEMLKVERNSKLKNLLELSIAKSYIITTSANIKENNITLPKWYFNNLTSIDAANFLATSPDDNIKVSAEEKYLDLLNKYLSEFEKTKEFTLYEKKIGGVPTVPENNNRKNKTKIYRFRRNEK